MKFKKMQAMVNYKVDEHSDIKVDNETLEKVQHHNYLG